MIPRSCARLSHSGLIAWGRLALLVNHARSKAAFTLLQSRIVLHMFYPC